MGWFKRKQQADGGGEPHVDPVVIDLGMQKEWEVEPIVGRLQSMGLNLHLFAQKEVPELGSLGPMHCRVIVDPDDVAQVRAELASAGFL